jgi:transposase
MQLIRCSNECESHATGYRAFTPEQQSCLTLHRTRQLFIRQQTSVINAIRAHLAEFGIVAPVGLHGVKQLLGVAT